ncbi:clostripain-related cysteine peptidase [Oribacterium sp. P6A1]|uniref:clostripain-related cysteine peptidase n=1 Tax=Oribacterium sp. P6A1 TaxID=1410612 RepID=UPI000566FFB3|nr:clostripain-related cysteine peptidase [Oribacterium sp. P6A1]
MWKEIKKVVIFILAALGLMFIILMLWPDDEEKSTETTVVEQTAADGNLREQTVAEKAISENTAAERTAAEQTAGEKTAEKKTLLEQMQSHISSGNINDQNGNSAAQEINVDTVSVGTDARSATIMVYINGSDLESEAGEATGDISEMIASGIGDNVNVIIQTMGTRRWQNYGISSKSAQTYKIENGGLRLIRDKLGQLDCTDKRTLSEFIGFCKSEYPADRYMFLFWDHGGGPVYGFGYDEWQSETDSLTIAEMAEAFSENEDVHFDIIGMDCCIMASMETCYALAPYCKYALLSEDFESGLGWDYTGWMKEFENNPGMATPLLGKYIVDAIIADNESSYGGGSACMGLFNVSTSGSLFEAWKAFAYKNEAALLKKNYSKMHRAKGRSYFDNWGFDYSFVTLSDYYISDILALVESIDKDSDEAKNLISALKAAVAYYGHTSDKNELTGLAVSLPYGDNEFYRRLRDVYSDIGLDAEYIDWLKGFVKSSGYDDYYDYYGFENNWGGWGDYESEYGCNISNGGSCQYGYDYSSCYGGGSGYNSYYDYGSYCDSNSYYDSSCYNNDGCYDDWIYDYEEEIWYCYDDGYLYLYDDETDTMFYYDEESDSIYSYDEYRDSWEYCG